MLTLMLLSLALTGAPQPPDALPTDPLQRCATRALRGDYGRLRTWQGDAYRTVLAKGITVQGRAKVTRYCPQCSGRTCADGSRVRPGICAAPRRVPMHSLVFIAGEGLYRVTDRGGAVQWAPSRYLRSGELAVFDTWVPDCPGGCWTGPGTRRRVPFAVLTGGH